MSAAASMYFRGWLHHESGNTRLRERGASGVTERDHLLGGSIERGTSILIYGAAGTGKSSLTIQFVHVAAMRGEKPLMIIFDESGG